MKTLFRKEFLRYGTKPYLLLRYAHHRTNALVFLSNGAAPDVRLYYVFLYLTSHFNLLLLSRRSTHSSLLSIPFLPTGILYKNRPVLSIYKVQHQHDH